MSSSLHTRGAGPRLSPLADADLRSMLLIRHLEAKLLDLFERGALNGTTHTCLGQEYVPVAVHGLLDTRDYVFSNHRGHGHYLARYDDPRGLLAEIMGRQGAVCNGVGGSQHILRDRYLSTGVQGQSLPVAAGVAMHLRRREPGRLACAFIGDGTWGEGAVYEALNMASLWRLPLLVVVEHNGIAQTTPTGMQMAGTIAGRAAAFDVSHVRIESKDVGEIRSVLRPMVDEVRWRGRPAVAEFVTHRLGPHSKGDDTRTTREIAHAGEQDWYSAYARAFADHWRVHDAAARERVDEVTAEVSALPPSQWRRR
ncbi:thiamine pyrophosphate-dependent dehydrogenase E1 component subunit alpha [Micromonospora sp. NPDC049240]|uniref:thiamine pyrophosphate-dependent dehydrogenase E1 component subunit alpha n=1 Tax=Micromonospora sp. NPDC049240 TaxID=3155151 RepID=UPI0033EDB616